jgi:hypothetical protein
MKCITCYVSFIKMIRSLRVLNSNLRATGYKSFANLTQEQLLKSKLAEHKTVNRYSPEDKRAGKLIDYVRAGEYNKALKLVKEEGVHPDSHTWNENTVLTDCAKRGDVKGTRFALNRLKCCITVSCHCPKHRSCFHYASIGGHTNVLYELYKFAEENNIPDINLLDSDEKTHLDVAKDEKTRQFIISNERTAIRCQLSGTQVYKLKAPDV